MIPTGYMISGCGLLKCDVKKGVSSLLPPSITSLSHCLPPSPPPLSLPATQPIPIGRQRPGLDRAPGLIHRAGHAWKLYIKQLHVMSRLMTLRVRV